MALEKTWQYDLNRVNPSTASITSANAAFAFYIKQLLTGAIAGITGGWTVYYACDSVTAGTPADAVDRWASAANVVHATGALAHSWIVLKSPNITAGAMSAAPLYCLISCTNLDNGGSTNVGSFRVQFCKTAPSGGSTTVDPTLGTNDWIGSATTVTYGLYPIHDTAAHHMHCGMTSDGLEFYILSSKDGTGVAYCAILFSVLANAKASDPYPYYTFQQWASGASGVSRGPLISSNLGFSTTYGFARQANAVLAAHPILIPTAISAAITDITSGPSDPTDATWFSFPSWIGFPSSSTVPYQFKGRIPDMLLGPVALVPQGTRDDTLTYSMVGALWLPANAAFTF